MVLGERSANGLVAGDFRSADSHNPGSDEDAAQAAPFCGGGSEGRSGSSLIGGQKFFDKPLRKPGGFRPVASDFRSPDGHTFFSGTVGEDYVPF
jgi:hypothetical protein